MEIIKQLLLILGACFAGEIIAALLPIAFPSSVIAMILLFVLLLSGVLKERNINKVGDFLLQNMSIFFLPSAIGILEHWVSSAGFWYSSCSFASSPRSSPLPQQLILSCSYRN